MISALANLVVFLVALLHVWFMVLEMFFWQKPLGMKIFHISRELAEQSAALAANQGLYNGFLSAGLFWSLLPGHTQQALHLKIFFLSCIVLAGIYAAYTVNRRIFIVQACPAILALILLGLAAT